MIQEAPFRSCLGRDCSTNTYFTKAFDPNFQYFTITDAKSHSLGHATVVLGTAKSESGTDVKVGFVDKLQNVPNQSIDYFLEAVRRSLLEKGYQLVLPVDVGGHNGLANEQYTRDFVQTQILPKLETEVLSTFTPHSHKYEFYNAYSRAYDKLNVRAFVQTSSIPNKEIHPGQKYRIRLANKKLNRDAFIKEMIKKRDSNDEAEVLQFINNNSLMSHFEQIGLYTKGEFEKDLENLSRSSNRSFTIRKNAFFQLLLSKYTPNQYYFAQGLVDAQEFGFDLKERVQMGSEIRQWGKGNDETKRDFYSLCESTWFRAAENHDLDSLKKIMSLSAVDVNALNTSGESALMRALDSDRFEVARMLLADGKTKKPSIEDVKHIVFNDVLNGKARNIEDLYNWGLVDFEARGEDGRTPLQVAIENGALEVVKKILQLQPQLAASNFIPGTSLIAHAKAFGQKDIALALEDFGITDAQTETKDWQSFYPKLDFIEVSASSRSDSIGSFAVASTPVTQQMMVELFGNSSFGLRQNSGLRQVSVRKDQSSNVFLPNHPVDSLSYAEAQKIVKKINEWSNADRPEIYKLIAGHKKGDQYDMMTKEQMDVIIGLAMTEDGRSWDELKQNEGTFNDYVNYGGNSVEAHTNRAQYRSIKSVYAKKPMFIGSHPLFDLRGNVSTWIKSGTKLGYLWGQSKVTFGTNAFSSNWEVVGQDYKKVDSSQTQGVGLRLVRLGSGKKEKGIFGFL